MSYPHMRWRSKALQITLDNFLINTVEDNKTIRLNSRDYAQATGDSIGLQSKPRQTVTTTGNVVGAEFSPRVSANVGCTALIALKADPVIQAGTSGTITAVRSIECNIDFSDSDTRTVTDVQCIRIFPDFGTVTVSQKKTVMTLATPNAGTWDYLFDFEASSGLFDETNGTYSTADGFLKIRVPEGDARIPYFLAVD